jgi:hypothetical protein
MIAFVLAASLLKPLAVYGTAAGADYGSTRYALAAGAKELNPPMRWSPEALKLAQVSLFTALDMEFQKRGHHGKAKAMRITVGVISVGVTCWNLRVGHRLRERRSAGCAGAGCPPANWTGAGRP